MLSKPLIEMTKCRWREFKREPSAFAFVLLFPVVFMIVLGLVFNSDAPKLKLVGISSNIAKTSKTFTALKEDKSIRLSRGDSSNLMTQMIRGKVSLIVSKSEDGSLSYTYDPNSPDGQLTNLYVDSLIQKSNGQIQSKKTEQKFVETSGSRYVDFLIPGLLAFSIMSTSMFGTGMVLVVNRRENLLKRYLTTPMKPFEYILSHVIGRQMIMFVEFAIIMLSGLIIFGFHIKGNFLAYATIAVLGTFLFTFMAMLIGSKTNNAGAYNGTSNLIMLPMMFLGGVWYSKAHFPDWLQVVANLLPITPLIDGLRAVALEGAGLSDLTFELTLLTVYTVIFALLSKRAFKWY
jgi:ABC-2 type transport system permease protein